ncbi:MAG: class I SAM-dependent methyltransferase [Deltaproteobacteria bacterium]|nr:class I SAM-dependent methyltransferase [Deltaproteobacteria bacterium]MCW5802335.1 class I SAM-dependent methyltransferase [Deltaproteobacteria bacterium]
MTAAAAEPGWCSDGAEAIRAAARSARGLRGEALHAALAAVPFLDRDAWVDALLGLPVPPPDADLPRGAVPYLPCGVEEIVAMVRDAPLGADDELVDLGSGLGRVVMLAHLLTGARVRGIEIQHHLAAMACERAADLGLAIPFLHADATAIPLATRADARRTVFFLYAPFNGEMLARALARLAEVARRRPIVVCTVGVALEASWLVARPSSCLALDVYDGAITS